MWCVVYIESTVCSPPGLNPVIVTRKTITAQPNYVYGYYGGKLVFSGYLKLKEIPQKWNGFVVFFVLENSGSGTFYVLVCSHW